LLATLPERTRICNLHRLSADSRLKILCIGGIIF
jgi:hypothetical protein